jgi:hypothetical protein
MVVKAVVSALFIVGINAIAQRNASLAGWIASLPLVTVLSIGWLSFDQRGGADISRFLMGVLWGMLPTAFLLVVTAGLLARGVHLSLAFAIGFAAWIACFLAAQQLGLVGG